MRSSRSSSSATMIFFIVAIMAVGVYLARSYFPKSTSEIVSNSDDTNEENIEEAIKGVIKNNPQLIVDAFNEAQAKSNLEAAEKTKAFLTSKKDELENAKSSPYSGDEKGDITIVEFFDYRCGYCKTVNKTVQELLSHDKKIKFIYKELPILGEESVFAAKVALAVYHIDNSKYSMFHNQLMQTANIDKPSIDKIVSSLGISAEVLKATMEKPAVTEELNRIQQLALQAGIRGTPAFVIEGELLTGAVDINSFKSKIETLRNNKK
jgi:protein-disulfide isomerase